MPSAASKKIKGKKPSGRFSTSPAIKRLVWTRAAGHCEQCGLDVTQDFRTGSTFNWADVAHILPASPQGPRRVTEHDDAAAQQHTDDPENLMLLCPSCHKRTDTDADGYPMADLSKHHRDHIEQIRHAAKRGETKRAMGLIVVSQHFASENVIRREDLLQAMLSEGLWAEQKIQILQLRAPGSSGRDEHYWQAVERDVDDALRDRLTMSTNSQGDPLNLAVVGLADMPSLMRVGRQLGDRTNRHLFSRDRSGTLRWTDPAAEAPTWVYSPAPAGEGPLALVIDLSAHLRDEEIAEALPGARIARFSTPTPHYGLVRNRGVLDSFRQTIQPRLSQLEASTADVIHLFVAIPAAMAIEFGALLSTQHAHRYQVYDRGDKNKFVAAMHLGPRR